LSPAILLLIVRVLLAVLLYGFLALLLVYLYRDMRLAERASQLSGPARLDLIQGGQVVESFPLARVSTVGRAVGNTICLDDVTVSAHHAQISHSQEGWWVQDLGSSNGTAVNGVQISTRVPLTEGDEIRVGNSRLQLHLAPPVGASKGRGETSEKLRGKLLRPS
jgi:pSer/pThr/pTyr-binding forkhead associated (FHA) protein